MLSGSASPRAFEGIRRGAGGWVALVAALLLLNLSLTFRNVWPTLAIRPSAELSPDLAVAILGILLVRWWTGRVSARFLRGAAVRLGAAARRTLRRRHDACALRAGRQSLLGSPPRTQRGRDVRDGGRAVADGAVSGRGGRGADRRLCRRTLVCRATRQGGREAGRAASAGGRGGCRRGALCRGSGRLAPGRPPAVRRSGRFGLRARGVRAGLRDERRRRRGARAAPGTAFGSVARGGRRCSAHLHGVVRRRELGAAGVSSRGSPRVGRSLRPTSARPDATSFRRASSRRPSAESRGSPTSACCPGPRCARTGATCG